MPYCPLVSIIIPLYNYAQYIVNCLDSCVCQDYSKVEIIVVDDCSSDRGPQYVKDYSRRDRRIRLLRNAQNAGYGASKNTGIRASNGALITTIDADDMLTQTSITSRVNVFAANPAVMMVSARAYVVHGDDSYGKARKKGARYRRNSVKPQPHAQTVMVRRDFYKKVGLYFKNLRSRGDNEMWWRALKVCKVNHIFLNEPVAFYRKHNKSMVAYRNRNKSYNQHVTQMLEARMKQILEKGIVRGNTEFL